MLMPRVPREKYVVVHIRTGDECLFCHDVDYASTLLSLFPNMHVVFESEHPLLEIERAFPEAEFRHSSVLAAVCLMAHAAAVVSTGSSFPALVTAFVDGPVVFEDVRKERKPSHFYPPTRAVLLERGRVIDDKQHKAL